MPGRAWAARLKFQNASAADDPRGARPFEEHVIGKLPGSDVASERETAHHWYEIADKLQKRRMATPDEQPWSRLRLGPDPDRVHAAPWMYGPETRTALSPNLAIMMSIEDPSIHRVSMRGALARGDRV